MSNKIAVNNVVSMTSREIAALTGKRHDHVTRDIDNMIGSLEQSPNLGNQVISSTYRDGSNIERRQYELDKEMTMTLVAGYNVRLRNAVVKRWLELEEQASAPKLPQTYLEALEAHLQSERDKLALTAQIEQQKPSVDFANRITNTKQTWSRRDAAKIIQYPPQAFNQWLKDNRHSNVNGAPSQTALNRGHQKVTCGEKNGHAYSNARITMKGLRYYATKIYSSEVPDDVLESLDNAQAQAEAQGE